MHIEFKTDDDLLILVYQTERDWLENIPKSDNDEIPLKKRVFNFFRYDIKSSPENDDVYIYNFVFGRLVGEYFKIEPRIFDIRNTVYIHKDIELSEKFFVTIRGFSVFSKIAALTKEDIYIGGENENSIPQIEFLRLISSFPSEYEIKKYTEARLGVVLGNYFDSASNRQEKYNSYMNKRATIISDDLIDTLKQSELNKYEMLLEKLSNMLKSESSYSEHQWQTEILEIILLLYPKYIYVFKEAPTKDAYTGQEKEIDILLVDSSGNIDIIEIKKPFDNKMITLEPSYRGNHIPMRDLSGTIMQLEKYIFWLNKSGTAGEKRLRDKYEKYLPLDFNIQITNPSGIIIMGRDNGFTKSQMNDLEIIKRKYKNIVDIITYDDLLRRLKNTIDKWKAK